MAKTRSGVFDWDGMARQSNRFPFAEISGVNPPLHQIDLGQ
jgi:hypothetical protein